MVTACDSFSILFRCKCWVARWVETFGEIWNKLTPGRVSIAEPPKYGAGLPVTQPVILFHNGSMKLCCYSHGLRKRTCSLELPISHFYPGSVFTTERTLSVSLTADLSQSHITRNVLLKILHSCRTLKRSVAKVTDSIGL